MIMKEKLERVKALGLYGKLPPDIAVWAGPMCCHPCSLGSLDKVETVVLTSEQNASVTEAIETS